MAVKTVIYTEGAIIFIVLCIFCSISLSIYVSILETQIIEK